MDAGHDPELVRCAAYAAAREALDAVHDASANTSWPAQLAREARRAAAYAVAVTAEGLAHRRGSAARRRCMRDALAHALALAATLDIARAHAAAARVGDDDNHERVAIAQQRASKTVALIGLLLHADFVAV